MVGCVRILGVAAIIISLAGCQGTLESSVSGRVTLDGQPLEKGTVTFYPAGDGTIAYGELQSGGQYELSTGSNNGIMPGDYSVTVVATGPVPADYQPAELLTPKKYSEKETTDLKVTVKPGKNNIPLVMTSE